MTKFTPYHNGLIVHAYHNTSVELIRLICDAIDAASSKWEYRKDERVEVKNSWFRQHGWAQDRRRPVGPEIRNCAYYQWNRNRYMIVENVKRDGFVTLWQDKSSPRTNCYVTSSNDDDTWVTPDHYKKSVELTGWFVERALYHFSDQIDRIEILPYQQAPTW